MSQIHSAQVGEVVPFDTFPQATGNRIQVPVVDERPQVDADLDRVIDRAVQRTIGQEPAITFSYRTFERVPNGWRRTQ